MWLSKDGIVIVVRKIEPDGRQAREASQAEALFAVLKDRPESTPLLLSQFGFSSRSQLPPQLISALNDQVPKAYKAGQQFEISTIETGIRGRKYESAQAAEKPASKLVQSAAWNRRKSWEASQLLDIFGFIANGRRFEVRYSLDKSENMKIRSGEIKFVPIISNDSYSGLLRYDLHVDQKRVVNFSDIHKFELTILE